MRKAFDANVPKLKPRLRGAAPAATLPLEALVDEAPQAVRVPFTSPRAETHASAPLVAAAQAAAAVQASAAVAAPAAVRAAPTRSAISSITASRSFAPFESGSKAKMGQPSEEACANLVHWRTTCFRRYSA